jgi:hypothetical protein
MRWGRTRTKEVPPSPRRRPTPPKDAQEAKPLDRIPSYVRAPYSSFRVADMIERCELRSTFAPGGGGPTRSHLASTSSRLLGRALVTVLPRVADESECEPNATRGPRRVEPTSARTC